MTGLYNPFLFYGIPTAGRGAGADKQKADRFQICRLVNSPGLEPGTPTLKVLCSTC